MTEEKEIKKVALASSFLGGYWNQSGVNSNPWSEKDFDKLDKYDVKDYRKVMNDCRFFFKHDSLASTIINKLIDIGITEIKVDQGTLSENEYKIFSGGVMEQIQTFATIYFCMSANNNKPNTSKIKDFDLEKIQQELQQFIRSDEKLDSNNIREEASIFLEKIMKFNKNQQKFIEAFYKEKKICPDLVDIDETKLIQHPALLHKINE